MGKPEVIGLTSCHHSVLRTGKAGSSSPHSFCLCSSQWVSWCQADCRSSSHPSEVSSSKQCSQRPLQTRCDNGTSNVDRRSVGFVIPTKSLALQHTIHLIREYWRHWNRHPGYDGRNPTSQENHSGHWRLHGRYDFGRNWRFLLFCFTKQVSFMSPCTYQSGQLFLTGTYSHMDKRGSRHLRAAIFSTLDF